MIKGNEIETMRGIMDLLKSNLDWMKDLYDRLDFELAKLENELSEPEEMDPCEGCIYPRGKSMKCVYCLRLYSDCKETCSAPDAVSGGGEIDAD